MFTPKVVANWKKVKRNHRRVDVVAEQVKKVLQTSDQQLILMVRG